MRVPYQELENTLREVLRKEGFEEERAAACARLFAEASLDGVYSHGLNRFPRFIAMIHRGVIDVHAEAECVARFGAIERWDGRRGAGNLNAQHGMDRAIALAREHGTGCVALRNTNHWMRGGSYGWQAAGAGAVGICWSNTNQNLPPWGSRERRIGNNPLILAVPRPEGHVVLDMAMSQFSYGALASYRRRAEPLPVDGGFDEGGRLTRDAAAIEQTGRPLPIGFWKGSGLSILLDLLAATLSDGKATNHIPTDPLEETDLSQVFIAFDLNQLGAERAACIADDVVRHVQQSVPAIEGTDVRYPGEGTLRTRRENREHGVPVEPDVWAEVQGMRRGGRRSSSEGGITDLRPEGEKERYATTKNHEQRTTPLDEVRWGIIGSGDVAEYKGGPALYHVDGSKLIAVMSRREEKAKNFAERHGAARHYTSAEALLEDDEVNAVYVATPPDVHAEHVAMAAERGKHVLCEKPMAQTVAECEAMIDVCRAHGVQLMIAYYRRFFPVVVKMKALLDEHRIGELVRARAELAGFYTPRADGERAWLTDAGRAGGGFMTDAGTHRLDLLAHFLGEVQEVSAFTDTQTFDFDVDDASSVIMRFEGGVHATAAFNWNIGSPIDEFELCGTGGRVLSRNLGRGDLEVLVEGETTETFELPAPAITHLGLVEHFVACLQSGTPNALPGEAGMQATRMTEAAYRSSREGRVVRPT